MIVDGNGENLFRKRLVDHILVQTFHDFSWAWDLVEQLLSGTVSALLLFKDRFTELNTFAADVHIPWSLNEWTHIAVAFAAERTEGIFFRSTGPSPIA